MHYDVTIQALAMCVHTIKVKTCRAEQLIQLQGSIINVRGTWYNRLCSQAMLS